MILEKKNARFKSFTTDSFISANHLMKLLEKKDEFKEELVNLYGLVESRKKVLQVGNAKPLVKSLLQLDEQCDKIDIDVEMKDVHLARMLEGEKAIFEIFSIDNEQILEKTHSDMLKVETRYSSKLELLDYYDFNKFANYCRDKEYFDLIEKIKDYLDAKNNYNSDSKKLRLVYDNQEDKFFLRAITSTQGYQDFGLNFSVVVALMALNDYVKASGNDIYVSNFSVDDSSLYVSFALDQKTRINDNLEIMFELILENDEIKRNAVSFNGMFKLIYSDETHESELFIKPKGLKRENVNTPTNLLTYQHRGKVENVLDKIKELPNLIEYFIEQVGDDSKRISDIKTPDEIRKFLIFKIQRAQKTEFHKYRDKVKDKLMSISVNNTFKLFELLRDVEELFESDDIVSRDYWRSKLYEALIERR